jgi:hypothetical protein
MATDLVSFTRGDAAGLLNVIDFLSISADHSLKGEQLDKIPAEAAQTLRQAVAEDGHDADVDLAGGVTVLHMVSGRVERKVVVAHIGLGGLNSIAYVVEGPRLLGRLYRSGRPEVVFLEHEVRTGDDNPVYVTGNTEYLGNWDTARALPLEPTGSGPGGYHWLIRIPLRPGQRIEFKFIKKVTVWEAGGNRDFTAGDQNATTSDNFREG